MEDIRVGEFYPISLARLQAIMRKYYGREYTEADREGYAQSNCRYIIDTTLTSDREAPHHIRDAQAFRESGKFCPLWMLMSVLAYRKEIPKGKYLLRVPEA